MPEVEVAIKGWKAPIQVRINGPNPTFTLRSDAIEVAAMRGTEPRLLDLLEIASAVFAADGTVRRGGETRPDMGTKWRRHFTFHIPVREPEFWSQQSVTEALTSLVEFLTEDRVAFRFSQATEPPNAEPYLDLYPHRPAFEADEVILFSGGLDSFSGALEILATTTSKVILVSHRSAQKVIPRQVELGKYLADAYPGRVLHLHVLARRKGQAATDTNQRSRSFLFAALGFVVANSFGARNISFFENGIVSHNLPLTPQIVGTMATRTTHPLSLTKMNQLLKLVAPNAPSVVNRYQWLTKTDVVQRIAQNGAAPQIARAVSCTSVRDQDSLRTHCGACSQCFDRRFAILAAGLAEHDPDEIYHTDIMLGDRVNNGAQVMAVEWTRSMLRFRELDAGRLMSELGLEVTRILEGHPNAARQKTLEQSLVMYKRQGDIVLSVLESEIQKHASDLASRKLPSTSLLSLWLASDGVEVAAVNKVWREEPFSADLDGAETDLVPNPNNPLKVAFWEEDRSCIVAVQGLCRIDGRTAHLAHGLKSQFDADRDIGLGPDDHAYLRPHAIPGFEGDAKNVVRSVIRRCRKKLADAYAEMHGKPPEEHLLIQTQQSQGYRLDPTIEVILPEEVS